MAQIRSKQIADFAAILDWTTVDSAAIAPAVDIYNLVSTETSQRVSADNSVKLYASTEMSTEVVNRLSGDASVKLYASTELSTEASIRAAADVVLSNNLSTEVAARIAGDNSLNTKVDFIIANVDPAALDSLTEIVSAFQSVDGDLEASILAVLSEHNAEVSFETSARISGDLSLTNALSAEISARISAINLEHDHHVSGDASVKLYASTELSTEASIRAAADVVLSNNLSTEVAARAAADVVLSNNLSTEVVNRTTADATLSTALSIEIDNRMAADWMAEELVTGVEGGTQITTANMFYGGNQDLEIYVNGLRVKYTMIDGQNFDLSIVYDLEETDKVIVLGVAVQ
jgi:hypothetical protein